MNSLHSLSIYPHNVIETSLTSDIQPEETFSETPQNNFSPFFLPEFCLEDQIFNETVKISI